MAGTLALIPALLTSCPRPPVYGPPVYLNFSLPEGAAQLKDLKIAAVYYEREGDTLTPQVLAGTYNYGYSTTGSVTLGLDTYSLNSLAANTKCVQAFKDTSTTGMKNISIDPDTVKVCNVYFLAYNDTDGNGKPTSEELKYTTHDMYSYASTAFRYSMTTTDGNSSESGQRTQGWSLVRHLVLQPSSTPGKYLVTMNSVPKDDQAIDIRLHEDTDFMISMSLPGGLK